MILVTVIIVGFLLVLLLSRSIDEIPYFCSILIMAPEEIQFLYIKIMHSRKKKKKRGSLHTVHKILMHKDKGVQKEK